MRSSFACWSSSLLNRPVVFPRAYNSVEKLASETIDLACFRATTLDGEHNSDPWAVPKQPDHAISKTAAPRYAKEQLGLFMLGW